MHGLHLVGGLVVWARTLRGLAMPGVKPLESRLAGQVCAVYWHYLLLVWLVLFGRCCPRDLKEAKPMAADALTTDAAAYSAAGLPGVPRISLQTSRRFRCRGAS